MRPHSFANGCKVTELQRSKCAQPSWAEEGKLTKERERERGGKGERACGQEIDSSATNVCSLAGECVCNLCEKWVNRSVLFCCCG